MKVTVDHIILAYAFRYALGRRTASVSDVIEAIYENLENIPSHILKVMNREIQEADLVDGLGDQCDKDNWLDLQKVLEKYVASNKGELCEWKHASALGMEISSCGAIWAKRSEDINYCPKCGKKIQEA